MQLSLIQDIVTALVVNATIALLIIYIFNIYKKKVENNELKVDRVDEKAEEIKKNYLSRFEEIKELIVDNDKVMMEKLHELENQITAIQTTCAFIQKTEVERG